MESTLIRKVKLLPGDSVIAEWPAALVESDRYGHWLYTPAGTHYRAWDGGQPLGAGKVGQGHLEHGTAVLHLVAEARGWFAAFYARHDARLLPWPATVRIDLCRPIAIVDGAWTYVDLELDLLGELGGGAVQQDDDEELDAAVGAGWVTAEEAATVRAEADRLQHAIAAGDEPFGKRWAEVLGAAEGLVTTLPLR